MTAAFEKLGKVLALERDQGHRNKAVIGGLDKFVVFWEEEVRAATEDPDSLRIVDEVVRLLKGYPAVQNLQEREQIVGHILGLLEERPKEEAVRKSPPRRRAPSPASPGLDSPVASLPGVSTAYSRRLANLGVRTIRDLLYLFPRRYDDYSALKPINRLTYGETVTIIGTVQETRVQDSRRGRKLIHSIIGDGTATIRCTWFNQPWLASKLRAGSTVMISGQVDEYLGRPTFQSPEWEPVEREQLHTGRIVPIYPLTAGLSAKVLRNHMKRVVDYWARRTPDPLPEEIRERERLIDLETALLDHILGSGS